jgi:transposase
MLPNDLPPWEAISQQGRRRPVAGEAVALANVDQDYTAEQAEADAAAPGLRPEAAKLPAAKRGFVLLPRRWTAERSFAWAARFRRLPRDYERLPPTVAGLHFLALACLLPHGLVALLAERP